MTMGPGSLDTFGSKIPWTAQMRIIFLQGFIANGMHYDFCTKANKAPQLVIGIIHKLCNCIFFIFESPPSPFLIKCFLPAVVPTFQKPCGCLCDSLASPPPRKFIF